MTAVVFGAGGNVGRHVVTGLLAAGDDVRATSRAPDSAGLPPDVEVVAADLERPETLPAALSGAEKVFLYAKPEGVEGFVGAAVAAGVRHVVLLSSAAIVAPAAEGSSGRSGTGESCAIRTRMRRPLRSTRPTSLRSRWRP